MKRLTPSQLKKKLDARPTRREMTDKFTRVDHIYAAMDRKCADMAYTFNNNEALLSRRTRTLLILWFLMALYLVIDRFFI